MSSAFNNGPVPANFWRPGEPGHAGRPGYHAAAVCRRGHVAESNLMALLSDPGMCAECGANVLAQCEHCDVRIRGIYYSNRMIASTYAPPAFCDGCGQPHPWATRQQRIYCLENILDQEDIDEADALWVREQLERLRQPNVSEDEQKKLWVAVKGKAPGLFGEAGKAILTAVASAAVRKALGL